MMCGGKRKGKEGMKRNMTRKKKKGTRERQKGKNR